MILGNLWKCKRRCHVYVVRWNGQVGPLYLGHGGSWQTHPCNALVFKTFALAEPQAAQFGGTIVDLGGYQPWCTCGWMPSQLVEMLEASTR